jgi:threonine/homoserine/homoserine lactone efflux protein
MSLESTTAFATMFLLLALAPGAGLAMILSRTLGAGMSAGFAVTTGLVIGDFIFLGLAAAGLSALATALGPLFEVIKYAGAAYLLWLGYRAFADAAKPITVTAQAGHGFWKDMIFGLLVTLGNPKPLLFYGALLPSFLDIGSVGARDYAILGAIVVVISYAVYGGYMVLIARTRQMLRSTQIIKRLNQATGVVFIGSGVLVAST